MAELATNGTVTPAPNARPMGTRRIEHNSKAPPTATTMTAFWYRTTVASARQNPANTAALEEPVSIDHTADRTPAVHNATLRACGHNPIEYSRENPPRANATDPSHGVDFSFEKRRSHQKT